MIWQVFYNRKVQYNSNVYEMVKQNKIKLMCLLVDKCKFVVAVEVIVILITMVYKINHF